MGPGGQAEMTSLFLINQRLKDQRNVSMKEEETEKREKTPEKSEPNFVKHILQPQLSGLHSVKTAEMKSGNRNYSLKSN